MAKLKPCIKLAAKDLQLMVRVEEASRDMMVKAVVGGAIRMVRSPFGCCVCRTCGKVRPYKSDPHAGEQMQGGHAVPSRRASIVLVEQNVFPQCAGCNKFRSGAHEDSKRYITATYGFAVYDDIIRRKNTESKQFSDSELMEIRSKYRARIRAAERTIELGEQFAPEPERAKNGKRTDSKKNSRATNVGLRLQGGRVLF